MMAPPTRQFDLRPLLAAIPEPVPPLTRLGVVRRALGIDQRNQSRLHRGLTVWMADRAAVAVGHHPAEIWGEQWWHGSGGVA
jgi:hypothetical protein